MLFCAVIGMFFDKAAALPLDTAAILCYTGNNTCIHAGISEGTALHTACGGAANDLNENEKENLT